MSRSSPVAKGKGRVAALAAVVAAIAVTFIGGWEGLRLKAYRDIVGVPTVCYGETRGVKLGDEHSKGECDAMLLAGLAEFAAGVFACVPALERDKPERVVAHVSLAYNVGVAGYCGSTVVRRYREGQIRASCDAFLMWNKAGGKVVAGLVRRRQAERELCLQ